MEVSEPAFAYYRRHHTIEEYLEMENAATEKHEYYQGEIFAMSGTKLQHNIITGNLFAALKNKLKGKPCRPYGSDMRIHIPKNTLFTYPDITIICGKPESIKDDELNFLNPSVIIEVLSPSTRNYDRETKFKLYRDIPTLKEYVLVEQDFVGIDAYYLSPHGVWELDQYGSLQSSLLVRSADVSVLLSDIYEGTKAMEDKLR